MFNRASILDCRQILLAITGTACKLKIRRIRRGKTNLAKCQPWVCELHIPTLITHKIIARGTTHNELTKELIRVGYL